MHRKDLASGKKGRILLMCLERRDGVGQEWTKIERLVSKPGFGRYFRISSRLSNKALGLAQDGKSDQYRRQIILKQTWKQCENAASSQEYDQPSDGTYRPVRCAISRITLLRRSFIHQSNVTS